MKRVQLPKKLKEFVELLSDLFFLGSGVGLTTSANSLALNTYFRERRRIVTGISWSCTALGPIVFPHIVTVLMPFFGVQGTVLIFSGIAMNAVCCALLLQPVRWHTGRKSKEESLVDQLPDVECPYCHSLKKKSHSLMSSQYLHNADNYFATGYEIIDPGTPMMARANDGWYSSSSAKRSLYGSKMSLTSRKMSEMGSRKASNQNLVGSNRPSYANLGSAAAPEVKVKRAKEIRPKEKIDESPSEDCPSHKSPQDLKHHLTVNPIRIYKTSPTTPTTNNPPFTLKQVSESKYLKDNKSNRSMQEGNAQSFRKRSNTFNIEKEVLSIARNKLEQYVNDASERMIKCTCEDVKRAHKLDMEFRKQDEEESEGDKPKFTFWQKFVVFFDLDLLKDFTYINIMIGITIANFAELNFSVLTPFVLADYGLEKSQIAICMSLLGLTDISVRFFIPFIAGFIGWQNRTFFLFGVLGMAMGRVGKRFDGAGRLMVIVSSVLAHFHTYQISLLVAMWIGFNKGLRTVFMALCIPSHVPLDRLPSATGLHLLFSGMFYICMGPVVGN